MFRERRSSPFPPVSRWGRWLAIAAFTLSALSASGAAAVPLPLPPCGDGSPAPDYAVVGPLPNLAIWHGADLGAAWSPPSCLGWSGSMTGRIVAVAGRFEASDVGVIADRVGAISQQRGIRYWSSSRRQWRALLDDAFALSGPAIKARRGDFKAAELQAGTSHYVAYDDSEPVGAVVESLTVRERTADRLVIATRNVSAARMLGLPVASEGDLELTLFFTRESGDVWRYYALSRAGLNLPTRLDLSEQDHLNRATAMFRFIAGYPTDAMPPAVH